MGGEVRNRNFIGEKTRERAKRPALCLATATRGQLRAVRPKSRLGELSMPGSVGSRSRGPPYFRRRGRRKTAGNYVREPGGPLGLSGGWGGAVRIDGVRIAGGRCGGCGREGGTGSLPWGEGRRIRARNSARWTIDRSSKSRLFIRRGREMSSVASLTGRVIRMSGFVRIDSD
jgi:hypothetical protein